MAHSKYYKQSNKREIEVSTLMTQRQIYNKSPEGILFYELEPAIVIDVIRDETHPIFKDKKNYPKVSTEEWPTNYNDSDTPDYSWIGRIRARLIIEQETTPVDELGWIIPQENTIREYPLVNELVIVSTYMNSRYYTRRLNTRNFINTSADYRYEHRYGKTKGITSTTSANLVGARNPSDISKESNKYGQYLGRYFKANHKIRPLKHFEGDTIIESRFGSSIRFGGYEDKPEIDRGTSYGDGESYDSNLGNPMILIRNRQRPTVDEEIKYQYNILEDVNRDGSSVQITSGNTVSQFISTISHSYDNIGYGCIGCRSGGFMGLYRLSKSAIGARKISSTGQPNSVGSLNGVATPNASAIKNTASATTDQLKTSTSDVLDQVSSKNPYTSMAMSLKKGGLGAAVGTGIGMAVAGPIGGMVGDRLGKLGESSFKKFINAPGSPTSNSRSHRKKFSKSIVSGNFSLNPVYERGIISAGTKAKSAAKNSLLGSSAGNAISAANSLGIEIPAVNDLGISSDDSPMFAIFKLASFGLKSICASVDGTSGSSKTENKLGWLLSIGIDLTLLALLMSLFEKLRNLKFNFGGFDGFNLDNLLFDLCDWVNKLEYKNTLVDTFRNEGNKLLTDAELTKQLGDTFIQDGTYNSFARNNTDFDMNYKSLVGDLSEIQDSAKNFGQTNIGLTKDDKSIAQVKFDPLTGLFREKQKTGEPQPTPVGGTMANLSIGGPGVSINDIKNSTTGSFSIDKANTPTRGSSTTPPTQNIPQHLYTTPAEKNNLTKLLSRELTPVPDQATETTSFLSGEKITRESLRGTVLENADLNAVSLLDKEDLDTLKNTDEVDAAVANATNLYKEEFSRELEKTEKRILKKSDSGAIFGKQLPELTGNQILLNSERILISSKTQETGIFSKKKFFVTTDDEITMDAKSRIVLRSDAHISFATPSIHLGSYTSECHPTLKGDCTTAWLSDLCGWLSSHVHHDPYITTSRPAQQGQLASLRARLPTLLSERIFISG
jgi:hypothetical protein